MNDDTILSGALNQLGQSAKQAIKQVVKVPGEMAEDAGAQIREKTDANLPSGGQSSQEQPESRFSSDEERKEFLKRLYGKSETSNLDQAEKDQKDKGKSLKDNEFERQIANKTPQEQEQLRQLRKALHGEYYQQLVNPKRQEEERPAEKVEKEKKIEMQELEQKKAERPPPLPIQRAQERVEKFPGASG